MGAVLAPRKLIMDILGPSTYAREKERVRVKGVRKMYISTHNNKTII
jgi:hypothetical protein